MKQRSFFSSLCFVLISFLASSISDPQTCMNNGNFIPNSTYDTNLRLILSHLPSNVTAQKSFFYNGSIGQEPNRVYAVGMCIPGSASNDCSDCIKGASNGLMQSCPNQTEAFSWPNEPTLCLVRYSNTSFLGSTDTDVQETFSGGEDIKLDLRKFGKRWQDLVSRMIATASAAKSTSSSSNNHYIVDATAVTPMLNIYALMQCTPDISSSDCENCLRQNVIAYERCCGQKEGGGVQRPSCFFRWNLFTFSNAFEQVVVASPPPPQVQPPSGGDRTNTTDKGRGENSRGVIVAIVVPIVVFVFVIIIILVLLARKYGVLCWRKEPYQEVDNDQSVITDIQPLQLDFKTIEVATNKFSRSNKVGQGGFGEVFKGTLVDGVEVAVKRLSKTSEQGAQEFKNEVALIVNLQHRNLVRLLGFCLEGEEKILVYEFVPNKSLDYFLFDSTKQAQLNWPKRYNIIEGIVRGILYLHQDSRLTIIHRDLKASNILLDADINPKIADFGMARIFGMDQTGANTNRIVGTRGYMSPEYIMQGVFSMKSDVYSFGVLVLEIIAGQKNIFVNQSDTIVENLVTYAWTLWREGTPLDLVDPTISYNFPTEEVTRCIHIALLCIQEDPKDRPSMSTIMMMLTSHSLLLPIAKPPRFFFPNRYNQEGAYGDFELSQSTIRPNSQSINDVTITDLDPR